jgi:hypothetical protein
MSLYELVKKVRGNFKKIFPFLKEKSKTSLSSESSLWKRIEKYSRLLFDEYHQHKVEEFSH